MRMRLAVSIVMTIAILPVACARGPEWEDLRRGATDCIVVVFSDETPASDIAAFLEEHTHGSTHPGGGYTLRAGVGAVIRRDVDGQTGYEICFQKNADPEQIRAIQDSLQASPLPTRIERWDSAEAVGELPVRATPAGERGS